MSGLRLWVRLAARRGLPRRTGNYGGGSREQRQVLTRLSFVCLFLVPSFVAECAQFRYIECDMGGAWTPSEISDTVLDAAGFFFFLSSFLSLGSKSYEQIYLENYMNVSRTWRDWMCSWSILCKDFSCWISVTQGFDIIRLPPLLIKKRG